MTFLAIVFTFGAISGEKEQGTLRQILGNSVPRPTIILAKTAAQFLILVGAFLAAMILSLLVLIASGFSLAGPGGILAETALALILSILVIGAFINLGLLVSALTRQAVSSFIILLLCWVFLFGVFPRLSVVISQMISPVRVLGANSSSRNETGSVWRTRKARSTEIAKIVESGDNARGKQDAVSAEFRGKLTEAFQKLDREQGNRQNAQMMLAVNISRLSPVSCFVRPMAEVARTGWMQFRCTVRTLADSVQRSTTRLRSVQGIPSKRRRKRRFQRRRIIPGAHIPSLPDQDRGRREKRSPRRSSAYRVQHSFLHRGVRRLP